MTSIHSMSRDLEFVTEGDTFLSPRKISKTSAVLVVWKDSKLLKGDIIKSLRPIHTTRVMKNIHKEYTSDAIILDQGGENREYEKFGVSTDSIKWQNNLTSDTIVIGAPLKIPPVTGIVHKVKQGETVYSIAKKYQTDAQKIVNFPFNDFIDLDTFALAVGQNVMVPDGVPPEEKPVLIAPPIQYFAGEGTGQFSWPTSGAITQYPVWYHMAVDIANRDAPNIIAADTGTVVLVEKQKYGYGWHVIVDHNNGYQTLYAHMQRINVDLGQKVTKGATVIGRMGSTGRSTGTHLHFEIRFKGRALNPLAILK